MNIYEYQAKRIFKDFGVNVPKGLIAYTPNEAKSAALQISKKGPWVVKAQIQAGSRDVGKFTDKRAGRRGGIRLSRTLDEVYKNSDEMLENKLITSQTDGKAHLVSRVYIEEYIKTHQKFYLGFVIDRISASVVLLIAPVKEKHSDDNIVGLANQNPDDILKLNIGLQKKITASQLNTIISFMGYTGKSSLLKAFLDKLLKIFYSYDATMLEINPFGINKEEKIWALDAKIVFDTNALYRHKDILKLNDETVISYREKTAAKYGFEYKTLDSGIGIIANGSGLALNVINEAHKRGLDIACFLNLKGGVDRDKIAASIKLIMTNPRVDGIFINILGGFSRCNLIADGIITVANELGLNIPLVARFEGTNKEEALNILQSSGLQHQIAQDTVSGLEILKEAIEEDF